MMMADEVNELRRVIFEREQDVDRLQRELRHCQGVNEDLLSELAVNRGKREEIDEML